jgi:hypothetical protein
MRRPLLVSPAPASTFRGRVIDKEAGKNCLSFETPINWNQHGLKGDPGNRVLPSAWCCGRVPAVPFCRRR